MVTLRSIRYDIKKILPSAHTLHFCPFCGPQSKRVVFLKACSIKRLLTETVFTARYELSLRMIEDDFRLQSFMTAQVVSRRPVTAEVTLHSEAVDVGLMVYKLAMRPPYFFSPVNGSRFIKQHNFQESLLIRVT